MTKKAFESLLWEILQQIFTRDLPMLWPQPTSDGMMATVTSVFPSSGREGATSPSGRKGSRDRRFSGLSYCPIWSFCYNEKSLKEIYVQLHNETTAFPCLVNLITTPQSFVWGISWRLTLCLPQSNYLCIIKADWSEVIRLDRILKWAPSFWLRQELRKSLCLSVRLSVCPCVCLW